MSASQKQPMSGLRTVKRDWSAPSTSQGTDSIDWPPSPPHQKREAAASRQKLSGYEQRLKHIQEALNSKKEAGDGAPASSIDAPKLMERVASGSKRQSLGDSQASSSQPPAKRRQLPSSWDERANSSSSKATSSGSSLSRASSAAVVKIVPGGNTAISKPASVFLSQEQTHILRLVQEGQSVFYTGSAGESVLHLIYASTYLA